MASVLVKERQHFILRLPVHRDLRDLRDWSRSRGYLLELDDIRAGGHCAAYPGGRSGIRDDNHVFNVAAGKKLGFRTLANVSDGLTESTFQGGRRIFISIIKYSMIFEGAGAVLLCLRFVPQYGGYGVWMGVFTSVTAFCNAGFDLCGISSPFASLTGYQSDPLVLVTVAMLITVGGLGFIVWENFLNIRKVRKLSLHTKAVLLTSAALTVGGTLFYLLAEWNGALGEMNFGGKLLNAFSRALPPEQPGTTPCR